MKQLGEQQPGRLAQAAGQLLRSGRMGIRAITPKKEGRQTSGSPIAPLSPGQANFGAQADVGVSHRATVTRAGKFWGGQADVGVSHRATVTRAGKFWGERADVGVTQRVTSASPSTATAGGSCTRGKERPDAQRIGRSIFAHFPGRHTGETEAAGTSVIPPIIQVVRSNVAMSFE